jgi:hypothetical protein
VREWRKENGPPVGIPKKNVHEIIREWAVKKRMAPPSDRTIRRYWDLDYRAADISGLAAVGQYYPVFLGKRSFNEVAHIALPANGEQSVRDI